MPAPNVSDGLEFLTDLILKGTDSSLQESFQGVYDAVIKFSNGLVAVGIFITGVYLILQFLISSQFDYASLLKMIVMLALYLGFTATIDLKNGSSIMAVTSNIMGQFEDAIKPPNNKYEVITTAVKNGQDDAKKEEDKKTALVGKAVDVGFAINSFSLVKILNDFVYLFLNMVVECAMVAIGFLIIFISKFACWLLIAFAPFCVAISFIKGFEGSFLGMLKYFIVFKLWAVIVAAIKLSLFHLRFVEAMAYDAGFHSITNSPSTSSIVMKICYCVVLCMTPMFADILVSGSQAGGFFSAAIAKGGAAIGSIASMGSKTGSGMMGNVGSNIGKNMGHLGGLVGAASKTASAFKDSGMKGVISGISKLGLNPKKNDGLKF